MVPCKTDQKKLFVSHVSPTNLVLNHIMLMIKAYYHRLSTNGHPLHLKSCGLSDSLKNITGLASPV